MVNTRTYPDGYTYEWLADMAAKGQPVEPGYDGIVFVVPAQLLRLVLNGDEQEVAILSVTRLPLGRLVAGAIDSDGNNVALPAIDPSGELKDTLPPTPTPVDGPGREAAKWLAEQYLGSARTRDPADPA
jgi:hypothetical protein